MATINLTWDASDTALGGTPSEYWIFRAVGDLSESHVDDSDTNPTQPQNQIATVARDAAMDTSGYTYADNTAVSGTAYSYTVVANNGGGSSSPAVNTNAKNIVA